MLQAQGRAEVRVEVVFALPDRQRLVSVQASEPLTVRE